MSTAIHLTGEKFGDWQVLDRDYSRGPGAFWICKCKCGVLKSIDGRELRRGRTSSCKTCASTIHGLKHHPLYNIHGDMMRRCYDPAHIGYSQYGGRGISVCDEWHDLRQFIRDLEPTYRDGLSLDRIDNDRGYYPDNCRWVTWQVQMINRRVRNGSVSGYTGVTWNKRIKRWKASITVNYKMENLGHYLTKEEAISARKEAEEKYFKPLLSLSL